MLKILYRLLLIAAARSEVYIVFEKDSGIQWYGAASTLLAPNFGKTSVYVEEVSQGSGADTCHDYACAGPAGAGNTCCATDKGPKKLVVK